MNPMPSSQVEQSRELDESHAWVAGPDRRASVKAYSAGPAPNAATSLAGVLLLVCAGICGCASQTGYNAAFANSTALSGNSRRFVATADQTFKTVKITLVQQGFTIEQTDAANGLIKGVRALEDPKNPKISYLITTSIDVTEAPSGGATVVTASASQQTVLHKDSEKYFHLLGLVPIPTGKDYQTIVRKEGNITDAGFYKDLFTAIQANIPRTPPVTVLAAPAPAVAIAAPVAAAPVSAAGSGGPVAAASAPAVVTSAPPDPAAAPAAIPPAAAPTVAAPPAPAPIATTSEAPAPPPAGSAEPGATTSTAGSAVTSTGAAPNSVATSTAPSTPLPPSTTN